MKHAGFFGLTAERGAGFAAFRRGFLRAALAFLAAALALGGAASAAAEEKPAAASIAPLHSLLLSVAGEESLLLISAAESPHHANLAPSRAKLLHGAAAVFYLDETFEVFLAPALKSLPSEVRRVRVTDGMKLLPYREYDDHGGHDDHDDHGDKHGDHDHDKHDDHGDEHDDHDGHDKHDDHGDEHDDHGGHDKHDDHGDEHGDHDGHGHEGHNHGEFDMHVWLDPVRAKQIAQTMADALAAAHPARADEYQTNARRLLARLDDLHKRLAEILAPARGRHYAVMHDAYQYFTRRYQLADAAAIADGSARVSARRLQEARRAIREKNIGCLLAETYEPPEKTARVAESFAEPLQVAVIDPLGAGFAPGEELYFELMETMARTFAECLAAS